MQGLRFTFLAAEIMTFCSLVMVNVILLILWLQDISDNYENTIDVCYNCFKWVLPKTPWWKTIQPSLCLIYGPNFYSAKNYLNDLNAQTQITDLNFQGHINTSGIKQQISHFLWTISAHVFISWCAWHSWLMIPELAQKLQRLWKR